MFRERNGQVRLRIAARRLASRSLPSISGDYLRVDFFDLGDRFFMTELTLYPASGVGGKVFERDVEMAKHWRNPRWAVTSAS